jgi:hypothetical protein
MGRELMANKFPTRGDFVIPSSLLDESEWMIDSLIDGETGHPCKIYYPSKPTECDNCVLDPRSHKSAHIYKAGGPIPFQDHTICPRCGGTGRNTLQTTDNVRLRLYFEPRDWIDIGIKFDVAFGVCMSIGYMSDLSKIERAERILLDTHVSEIKRWYCKRAGEAVPHGFRHKRYFIQYLERVGGG